MELFVSFNFPGNRQSVWSVVDRERLNLVSLQVVQFCSPPLKPPIHVSYKAKVTRVTRPCVVGWEWVETMTLKCHSWWRGIDSRGSELLPGHWGRSLPKTVGIYQRDSCWISRGPFLLIYFLPPFQDKSWWLLLKRKKYICLTGSCRKCPDRLFEKEYFG